MFGIKYARDEAGEREFSTQLAERLVGDLFGRNGSQARRFSSDQAISEILIDTSASGHEMSMPVADGQPFLESSMIAEHSQSRQAQRHREMQRPGIAADVQ